MVINDAQDQALGTWSAKENSESKPDRRSDSGIGSTSSAIGSESFGISGNAWQKEIVPQQFGGDRIDGKIIAQLISDAQDQLEEARACIKRYQEQEKQALKRLETLHGIQELIQRKTAIQETE